MALLADRAHFSDALTAVPLWVALVFARRPASRRYTYGLARVEDLAGVFIVAIIALSAVSAGVESIRRLRDPQPIGNLGWGALAGLLGFVGNELAAVYRIRVGRRIGSAAVVADGLHARPGGFTSLAVVLGVAGVAASFPVGRPGRGPTRDGRDPVHAAWPRSRSTPTDGRRESAADRRGRSRTTQYGRGRGGR